MSWWNWPLKLLMTLDGPSPTNGPSAMDDIQGALAGVAASAGNPNAVAALNSERAYRQSLQNDQMRQQELQSELQSQDLQRQMMSKQLGAFLTPAQLADLNVSTAQRLGDVQQQYRQPELIPTTGADGRITYYQSSWNPQTRSYSINPATTMQETTVSSPDSVQPPFAPNEVIKQLGPVPLTSANPELTKMQWQNQLELGRERALALDPDVQRSKINVASAEGQARANVEAAMARGSNAALSGVPPHLVAPATAEATKLGTDYATFTGQMANLKSQLAAAQTGDQVASAFAPVATALGSNAFYGTHRLAPAEVQALGPALGSVAREINTWFDKHATGTLPSGSVNEFSNLVDRLSAAKKLSYQTGLNILNQNYGSKFQPLPDSTGSPVSGGGDFFSQFGGQPRTQ